MDLIHGEIVKSALGAEIMRAFPGVTWYKERVINLRFPHFFVHQLTLDTIENRRGFWWLNYFINIRYRVAAEPDNVTNIQEQLDNVGLQILSNIKSITVSGLTKKLQSPRYEKVDGVLHYFCNITLQATEEEAEAVLQQQLELNQTLKGG